VLPARPSWLPDDGPTIPLDASDTVGLLVCALMAVYGHREARTLAATISSELDGWFRAMRSPA
jgi:hypothetical protein